MRKDLLSVFNYFGYFSYAPSFEEIYTFFPKKITRKQLLSYLARTYKQKKLVRLPKNTRIGASQRSFYSLNLGFEFPRYTLPQYSTCVQLTANSKQRDYLDIRVQIYILILKIIPLVRFAGITGKSAVEGPRMNDDIDLFIIAKSGFIWTTRFIVVSLAKMLGIHGGNGVCLNLFFDELDLTITKIKQNSYIAHEILQMKPLVDKESIFYAFIETNKWIFEYFPNASFVIPVNAGIQAIPSSEGVTHRIDYLFKSIQLPIIKKNRTGFRITKHQLWLFKHDFEKKIKH